MSTGLTPRSASRLPFRGGRAAGKLLFCVLLALLPAAGLADIQKSDFAARRAEAERKSGGSRAKEFVQLARDEMEAANEAFTAGEVDQGHKLAGEAYADAQRAANAAHISGKRLKDTEIDLRKLQTRTRDITRSLAFDDRPRMEKIVEQIEELRQTLLEHMFGGKKKKDKS